MAGERNPLRLSSFTRVNCQSREPARWFSLCKGGLD
jgi:hypothetical protein